MARPVSLEAQDSAADLLAVHFFIDRITAAIIMADHKKPAGFIHIDRNSDAAQHFPDIFLIG